MPVWFCSSKRESNWPPHPEIGVKNEQHDICSPDAKRAQSRPSARRLRALHALNASDALPKAKMRTGAGLARWLLSGEGGG